MPEISVIVPVYRARDFLQKCTDSILAQTFSDLELLLIDDGSPDDSGALCDRIAQTDPRVRVFHQENGGVSAARNLGLAQAAGTWLAFADADDWLPPDALQRMHEALTQAGADAAGGAHWRVEPDGRQEQEPGALPPGVYGPAEIRRGIVDRLLGSGLASPERSSTDSSGVSSFPGRSCRRRGWPSRGLIWRMSFSCWNTSATPRSWPWSGNRCTIASRTHSPSPGVTCPTTCRPSRASCGPARPWPSAWRWGRGAAVAGELLLGRPAHCHRQ